MFGPLFDPSTLSVATAAMLVLLAASLFHVATHAPTPDSVRVWGRSCLLGAIGLGLRVAGTGETPGALLALGDLTLAIALILQVSALAAFAGLGDRLVRVLVIITIAQAAVSVQFAGLDPDPRIRQVCSDLIGALGLFAAALIGWHPTRTEFARLGRMLAASYGTSGLLYLALGLWRLDGSATAGADGAGWALLAVHTLQVLPPLALLSLSYSQLSRQLARSATLDPLTLAANRRGLAEAWDLLQARARRGDEGWHVGVVMVDIDHFKSLNQTHGHSAGDTVLQLVVEVMRKAARRYDTVSRFGGEEFCMLLPGVTIRQAQIVTERIRKRITELSRERTGIDVTVSAGITVANAGQTAIEQAVDAADQMLYIAKSEGRDRSRVDPDALRVIAGLAPVARSGKADELGFPLV